MKRLYALLLLVCLAATPTSPLVAQEEAPARALKVKRLTDAQIKKLLIQASIDEYPGNCPCPYNQASNGSRCGKRSAWSREEGIPRSVTPQTSPPRWSKPTEQR
jgi:hypothetical protein